MSLGTNEDDIVSLNKKLTDWSRRDSELFEHVLRLHKEQFKFDKREWILALSEVEKLSAEGCELFEALLDKVKLATCSSLYERRYRANALMDEIQMVADANSSSSHTGWGYIDGEIPDPYPIVILQEFVDKWKEQDARVQNVKKALSSLMSLEQQKE